MIRFDPSAPAPLSARDRGLLAGWACLLVASVLAPRLHGYLIAPEGWRFVGFVGRYRNDYWSYLAWIRQALEGEILFRDLFTGEPHPAAFFHPVFWAVGALTRVTGLPVMVGWSLAEVVGVVVLVLALGRFVAEFSDDALSRRLAVILATTASGLGWTIGYVSGVRPEVQSVDLWMPEASGFMALHSSFFTLTTSLGLLLLALVHALRHWRGGGARELVLGGLYALLLALVHQYDAVVLFSVLAAWSLVVGRRSWPAILAQGLCVLPVAVYGLLMITVHPVFSRVTWSMPVPTVGAHLLGLGTPLALAALALADPAVRRGQRNVALLGCWLAVVPLLLLLPIGFARKLVWGVQVPLAVLAAMALSHWVRRSAPAPRLRASLLVGAVAFMAVGSFTYYADQFQRNSSLHFADYLPEPYYEAFAWMERNIGPRDVMLAWDPLSPMIPGNTGRVVYQGHWAQTLDPTVKIAFARRVFSAADPSSPEVLSAELAARGIRYVVEDVAAFEGDARLRSRVRARLARSATRVFDNGAVSVWEISAGAAEPRLR